MTPTQLRIRRLGLTLILGSTLGLLPAAAKAQSCDRFGCGRLSCATPATPVPQQLWGELEPADTGALPAVRDATSFNEFQEASTRAATGTWASMRRTATCSPRSPKA